MRSMLNAKMLWSLAFGLLAFGFWLPTPKRAKRTRRKVNHFQDLRNRKLAESAQRRKPMLGNPSRMVVCFDEPVHPVSLFSKFLAFPTNSTKGETLRTLRGREVEMAGYLQAHVGPKDEYPICDGKRITTRRGAKGNRKT